MNDADQIVKSIVSLHSQPDVLLLHCLDDELLSKGDLSIVAREQTPTVFVLKECLSLFPSSVDHLLFGLLKFGESLTSKHLHLLCDPFPRLEVGQSDVDHRSCKHHPGCKHSLKLRKKLQKETMKLLSASSIPIELCVLCHRCTLLIEQTPNVQRDESVPIENWTVTAFLFLRFIVPMVTTSSQREKNGKGISFLSRFLMKLCCRSKFRGSGNVVRVAHHGFSLRSRSKSSGVEVSRKLSDKTRGGSGDGDGDGERLVNLILEDCFKSFDCFCSEIRERGRTFWGDQLHIERKSFSWVQHSEWAREGWEKEILRAVEKYKDLILLKSKNKEELGVHSLLASFREELQKSSHSVAAEPQSVSLSPIPQSSSLLSLKSRSLQNRPSESSEETKLPPNFSLPFFQKKKTKNVSLPNLPLSSELRSEETYSPPPHT